MKRKIGLFSILDLIRTVLNPVFLSLLIASSANNWPGYWTVAFFVLYVCMLLISIAKPLYSREKLRALDWFEVIFHFFTIVIFAIVDAIYLRDFFTETTTEIICVILGGLLTLYGVGISIKFNIWGEQERERNNLKPHVFPVAQETWNNTKTELKRFKTIKEIFTNLDESDNKKPHFHFGDIKLYNSDHATCTFKGLLINESQFLINKFDEVLIKDSFNCFIIDYRFQIDNLKTIKVVFGDMLDNTYVGLAHFHVIENKPKKESVIEICGIMNISLCNDINCNRIVEDYFKKKKKTK